MKNNKSPWFKYGGPIGRPFGTTGWQGKLTIAVFILFAFGAIFVASALHSLLLMLVSFTVLAFIFGKVVAAHTR